MDQKTPQTALVTGASSGIGEALCQELITRGWHVVGVARSLDKLNQLKEALGEKFIPIECDVSKKESITHASDQMVQKGFYPSLFFLNAGISGGRAVEDPKKFDLSIHEKIMAVNYFGVMGWVQYWEKIAQDHGGATFIATSSINAIFAPPKVSAYAASKAAIARAFESLSLTYFDTNLRFAVTYPGPVDTPGLRIRKKKIPFTWKAEKMAKHMVDSVLKGKIHDEPSIFYGILTRFVRILPSRWTTYLLRNF
jgi:3-hydroxy acid dehydrogenase / malonic semialdehyde reductase